MMQTDIGAGVGGAAGPIAGMAGPHGGIGANAPGYPPILALRGAGADPVGDAPATPTAPTAAPTAGTCATLQARALAAANAAWARAFSSVQGQWLTRDMRRVKGEAAGLVAQRRFAECVALWRDAEMRWSGIKAASSDPGQITAAHLANARPLDASVRDVSAEAIISRLAGRGVTLLVGDDGQVRATCASLLNGTDRAQIRDNKAALVAALGVAEVVA